MSANSLKREHIKLVNYLFLLILFFLFLKGKKTVILYPTKTKQCKLECYIKENFKKMFTVGLYKKTE